MLISSYDIYDAALSGYGFWSHFYNGTITPVGDFIVVGGGAVAVGNYADGSGTLNDGVIGTTANDTQLFTADTTTAGTVISPTIILKLPSAYIIDTIEIYGGNIAGNYIPGLITGFSVDILDQDLNGIGPVAFSTTDFGPETNANGLLVNDRVNLNGSSLAGIAAYALSLSDFQFVPMGGNDFSITEIKLYGSLAVNPVPVPAALPILGAALAGFGFAGWRTRRKAA